MTQSGGRRVDEPRANTTERLQAENARLRKELQDLNREYDEFLYVVSHDLKEPLRIIKSFSSLLLRDYAEGLPDVAKRFVGVLDDGARRLENLLDDVLELSRVGRRTTPPEDVGLREILDEAVSSLAELATPRHAEITVTGPMPTVFYTREELQFVVRELLTNALKFNHAEPPKVAVSVEEDEGCHWVVVTDNGIGVETRYEEKLFRIFYRNIRREDYEGTGAGLTIAKKMVERHGGQIRLREGAEGKGSTFAFSIPKHSPLV